MRGGIRALLGALSVWIVCAAAPAAIACGDLTVDGAVYSERGRCLSLGEQSERRFENNSDSAVAIYPEAGCAGGIGAILGAGQSGTVTSQSMKVD